MTHALRTRLRGALLGVTLIVVACRQPDDPAIAAWRTRLAQDTRLTDDELKRLRADVGKQVSGKVVRVTENGVARTLDEAETAATLEVLTLPAGVFDEGIRREGERTVRVLNGPAASDNAEIEAAQRLMIDVQTLRPVRYEFAYAVPSYGTEIRYDLLVESK